MSRLGIAFVLPYTGANGIVVNNNVIGLDPSGTAAIGRLILNENQDQAGANLLVINTGAFGSPTANAALLIDNVAAGEFEMSIDSYGNTNIALGSGGNLVSRNIQTIANNPNAPTVSFDADFDGTGIPVSTNGNPIGDLLIEQP